MIAIVDYGMANLRSVERAFAAIGADPVITGDPAVVAQADRVVLPGVGAFCACMKNLVDRGLSESVRQAIVSGKPFLGICVGMQMLFETSSEMGMNPGLGLLPGHVVKFFDASPQANVDHLKVPHIGWNALRINPAANLFQGLSDGDRVYFVHSFYAAPGEPSITAAECEYGIDFCCAIETRNIAATQFHPEKSGAVGLQILRNFVSWHPVV